MKNMKTFIFLMCAAIAPVQATTTIYSQGWDGASNGMSSTYDTTTASEVSSVLDTFTLGSSISNVDVTNIGWWGGYSSGFTPTPTPNAFYVEIGVQNGAPIVQFSGLATPTATAQSLVSFYSMDLGAVAQLSGGVDYYILIQAEHDVNLANLASSSWYWAYDTAATGDTGFYYNNIDAVGNDPSNPFFMNKDTAFVLNAVPEPATIWLVMLALAGMVLVRHRSATLEA